MADGVAPVPFHMEKVLSNNVASPNPPLNMDSKVTTGPSVPNPAHAEPSKPILSYAPPSAPGSSQQTQSVTSNSAAGPPSGLGTDGAGPAVAHPAPKPVEVMSVPDTPVNGSTPAGQSPRPELNIPAEETMKTDAENKDATAITDTTGSHGEREKDTLGKPAAPGLSGITVPKQDALPVPAKPTEPLAAIQPPVSEPPSAFPAPTATESVVTGEKRKLEESGLNGTAGGAPAVPHGEKDSLAVGGGPAGSHENDSRADKKIKTDNGPVKAAPVPATTALAPASAASTTTAPPVATSKTTAPVEQPAGEKANGNGAGESKIKKVGKATVKKVAAAVGRTQRKTRSQGAAEGSSL